MEKQDKSRRQKKTAGWVIAVLLLCVAAGVGSWYWRKLPAVRVMRGIANLAEEIKEYENPVLQEAGWKEILKQLQYGAVHAKADVELESSGIGIFTPDLGLVSSMGLRERIELEGSIDQQNQLLSSSLKLHMLEREILEADVAADAENLYITLPALLEDTLRLETTDFGAKFNASSWHEITGWTLPEDYQLTIFREDLQETMAEAENIFDPKLYEQLLSKTGMLARNITVTFAGKSVETEKEGQQETCKGYFVSIEPETLNSMLSAVRAELQSSTGGKLPEEADFLNGSLTEKVKLEVYLDAKDRIVQLKTAEPLRFSDPAVMIELTAALTGTERTADEAECRIYVIRDTEEGTLAMTWNAAPLEGSCKKRLDVEWIPVQVYSEIQGGSDSDPEGGSSPENSSSPENDSFREKKFHMESEWEYTSAGFDITAVYSGDDSSYDIKLQGMLEAVTAGEAVRITLDSAEIQKDGKEPVMLSGSFSVEPLSEEIMIPEESVDLFSLSVLDMIKLLMHFQIESAAGL